MKTISENSTTEETIESAKRRFAACNSHPLNREMTMWQRLPTLGAPETSAKPAKGGLTITRGSRATASASPMISWLGRPAMAKSVAFAWLALAAIKIFGCPTGLMTQLVWHRETFNAWGACLFS